MTLTTDEKIDVLIEYLNNLGANLKNFDDLLAMIEKYKRDK